MKNWEKYRPKEFKFYNGWIQNWFSNMIECDIVIDGVSYRSTENYFQAMKAIDPDTRNTIAKLTPRISKSVGRKLIIRPDWQDVKYEVMKTALRAKFNISEWKKKLLDTQDEIIIEWNNWNDKIWGVSYLDNLGENLLGKALMEIREELRLQT